MQPDERRGEDCPFFWVPCSQYNKIKLGHLAKHFEIVGGDKTVIEAANKLSKALSSIVLSTRNVLDSKAGGTFALSTYPLISAQASFKNDGLL